MNEDMSLSFEELSKFLDEFDYSAFAKAKKLRKERPWVRDIVAVLYARPDGIRIDQLVDELWAMRDKTLPTPKKFLESVQSRLNHYTSQSAVFIRRNAPPEDDLFYSPQGKGSGTWAVRRERSVAWLKRKQLQEI